MNQLFYQLDPLLKDIFEDDELNQELWFKLMEIIIRRKSSLDVAFKPHKLIFDTTEPYQIVLEYVRWKANRRATYDKKNSHLYD
jgi:hypothetical protein